MRKIEIVPYDSSWETIFEIEKKLIAEILGDFRFEIHHIGSTSVFGMAAKPVIDILVEMDDISVLDEIGFLFAKLEYKPNGENGIAGRRYFQKGGDARSHHIHAFNTGSEEVKRHLAFKRYLCSNIRAAKAYAKLKYQAANRFRYDSVAYSDAKNEFMQIHEKIALEQ